MKVTITDIANAVGCAVSTVSKALTDSTDVNVKTKEAVLKCAVEMGYAIGRKKARSKGTFAAVIQCSALDKIRFEYNLLFGFKLEASRAGYDVEVVIKSPDDHNWSFAKHIENSKKSYCGAFLLHVEKTDRLVKEVNASSLPVVAFDENYDAPMSAFVGCDGAYGIALAVKHLCEYNHKRIAFFGGSPGALVSVERKRSFITAMRDEGREVLPELIAESNFSQNFAPSIIPDFVACGATAIVCASDLLASYAVAELERLGLRIPRDISVVGFDNVPLSEEIDPPLTTVDQNLVEIGKSAFFLFERLLEGVSISKMQFKPKLIVRGSTAPVK